MKLFHSEHHYHFLFFHQIGVIIEFQHTNYFFYLRDNNYQSISDTLLNLYLLAHCSPVLVEVLQRNKEIKLLYDSNFFKFCCFVGSNIFRIHLNYEMVAIFVTTHAHDCYYLTIHKEIRPI
jgi:hypothetical protein